MDLGWKIQLLNSSLKVEHQLPVPRDISPIYYGINDKWHNKKLDCELSYSSEGMQRICLAIQNKKLQLVTAKDLADLLEVPLGNLWYIINNKKYFYRHFVINKKNGGKRDIYAPINGLDIVQRKIKSILECFYYPKKSVHGFVKQRGIITNARQHIKKKVVVNLDLENFFETINFARIYGLFCAHPFYMGSGAASILADLCTFSQDKVLPQGASTSPILSNFIASSLDKKLTAFAKDHRMIYTRYVDDITFSSNSSHVKKIFYSKMMGTYDIPSSLRAIVKNCNFRINEEKFRVQTHLEKQMVTGLVVNKKVNLARKYIRITRAMINNWEQDKKSAAQKFFKIDNVDETQIETFRRHIYGRLGFINMVRGDDFAPYINLMARMASNDSNPTKKGIEMKEKAEFYDVFICHASEDKQKVAQPLYDKLKEHEVKAFLDNESILLGDSFIDKINNALAKAKYTIIVLSENSVDKAWPMAEIKSAINREINGKARVIPLILNPGETKIEMNLFKERLSDALPLLAHKNPGYLNNMKDCEEELDKFVDGLMKVFMRDK